jgi:hypothetical protein
LLWLVLIALLLVTQPAYGQEQTPDLTTYLGWLRAASAAAQRNDRLGLEEVAQQLIGTTNVRLDDGSLALIDNRWLRDMVDDPDPNFRAIEARLGAIINALAQPDSAAPADARERLQALLNRPPYTDQDTSDSWLDDFLNWLGRILDIMFRPVSGAASPAGNVVAWVIGGVGFVLLVGVIIYLVLGLRRNLVSEARTADDDPEAHLTARTALDQAGDLARSGDHRTAMRYLYLSALLWLDERDMLRYDRALTNREYLERVRENPSLRSRLTPIVETFDRVWYGHAPLDDAAFDAYRAQVEALKREP